MGRSGPQGSQALLWEPRVKETEGSEGGVERPHYTPNTRKKLCIFASLPVHPSENSATSVSFSGLLRKAQQPLPSVSLGWVFPCLAPWALVEQMVLGPLHARVWAKH